MITETERMKLAENFSDHNFVKCELLLDLICNTKKLCSDNIYTTILPKLKLNGATSELWDSYLDTLNLDNWCDLVNEDSSIDLKVNILIQKIEEAALDVFEWCNEPKHPKIPKYVRKLFKQKSKLSKQLMKTRSAEKLVSL